MLIGSGLTVLRPPVFAPQILYQLDPHGVKRYVLTNECIEKSWWCETLVDLTPWCCWGSQHGVGRCPCRAQRRSFPLASQSRRGQHVSAADEPAFHRNGRNIFTAVAANATIGIGTSGCSDHWGWATPAKPVWFVYICLPPLKWSPRAATPVFNSSWLQNDRLVFLFIPWHVNGEIRATIGRRLSSPMSASRDSSSHSSPCLQLCPSGTHIHPTIHGKLIPYPRCHQYHVEHLSQWTSMRTETLASGRVHVSPTEGAEAGGTQPC